MVPDYSFCSLLFQTFLYLNNVPGDLHHGVRVEGGVLPCTESYLIRYARFSIDVEELAAVSRMFSGGFSLYA
jgi:hypothetical protein